MFLTPHSSTSIATIVAPLFRGNEPRKPSPWAAQLIEEGHGFLTVMIENSMEVFATIPTADGEITYKIVTNDYEISGDDKRCIYDALTSHHQLLGPDPVVIGARYLSSNLQCNVPNPVSNESTDCCAIVDYASDAGSKVETPSRRRKRVFQPRQIGELPTSVLHSYIVVADLFNEISLSYMLVDRTDKSWYVGNDEQILFNLATSIMVVNAFSYNNLEVEHVDRTAVKVTNIETKASIILRTTTIGKYIRERRSCNAEPEQVYLDQAMSKKFRKRALSERDVVYKHGDTGENPFEFPYWPT